MENLPGFLIAMCCSYPLFWLQSFDARYRVRVYSKRDLDAPSAIETDERPLSFNVGAAIWAATFGATYAFSADRCRVQGFTSFGLEPVFGLLATAMTAKALFGAAAESHKRLFLQRGTTVVRPRSWRLLDVITPVPVNLTVVPLTKLIWFPVLGAAAWALNGFRKDESSLVIPVYAHLVGFFLVLARLAQMNVSRNRIPLRAQLGGESAPHYQGAALAVIAGLCVMSFFVTTVLLDGVLERCGAAPGEMPTYEMLAAGLAALPVLSAIGAGLAALMDSLTTAEGIS